MEAIIPYWETTAHLERKLKESEERWKTLYRRRIFALYNDFIFEFLRGEFPLRKVSESRLIKSLMCHEFNKTWKFYVSILNILEPQMQDILNKTNDYPIFQLASYSFVMGWMNLAINDSDLIKAEQNLSNGYFKLLEDHGTATLGGDLLKTFPDFPMEVRCAAVEKLYKERFSTPIYRDKWNALKGDINRELSFRAGEEKLSKGEKKKLTKSSILAGIFELPLYPVQIKKDGAHEERPLWDLSISELSEKPEIFKRAMAALTINDLAPKGYHAYLGDRVIGCPYVEEVKGRNDSNEPLGELEITAMNLGKKLTDEWLHGEMNQFCLEDKLKYLNLTPRERVIIEAKLSGKMPTGTPGSVKVALSKLKKKIQKK